MATQVLATKLYIPPPPPRAILRPRLIRWLDDGLHRKLTLISAPAGFGKTTLLSAWAASLSTDFGPPMNSRSLSVAWLSLDEGDSDPTRFLTYLIAALRTVVENIGERLLGVLQTPQPPPTETILTALLNEIAGTQDSIVLVLDDYHIIDSAIVDNGLTFLIEHLPPQLRVVIATREDPQLPLARLRARDQLTELRVTDLRFTPSEAADFLRTMGLDLSAEDIEALETRTEGWIAGLQLAAISMQGHEDTAAFIKSFTGGHHFVMDFLVEEVLQQQPQSVQNFLLRTSILDRLCGPLCDAVLLDPGAPGQQTLEYLERANLFTIPLDNERRWYRYHHLFADLLRQRLQQTIGQELSTNPSSVVSRRSSVPELHERASQWYEDNGLPVQAFYHAVAADDFDRTARIVQGRGIPLHFRGMVTDILNWLESLPRATLDARPSLWANYASLLLIGGQTTGVAEKLQTAEAALQGMESDEKARPLIGQIAAARATLALTRYDAETMLTQSRRALEYMHPNNLSLRANAYWTLGYAYFLEGERVMARQALTEAVALSQASGSIFTTILSTIGLGTVQEADNQLYQAAETYRHVLQMASDQPLQIIYEAHLGLARILYEWNDLEAAEEHGRKSLHLARQYESVIDRFIVCEVFLAKVKLAQGDISGAAAILAQSAQSARDRNFVYRIPEVAAAQLHLLLRQGNLAAAAELADSYDIPFSRARVHLAQGNPAAALAVLEPLRHEMEARGWEDERLRIMLLQALTFNTYGEKEKALQVLDEALALAEPGGFVRIFVDEGPFMAHLLAKAARGNIMPGYISKLLSAFEAEPWRSANQPTLLSSNSSQSLVEPLSQRELEVLRLISQGLSNDEISETLILALDTVKGHNRKIYGKLQVQRRTEAVARARELGLL